MNKAILQLGKTGDIINLLPLLWKDAQSGEKPKLVVAAEFSSLLQGVSYVETIIYQGPHYEIEKAIRHISEVGGGTGGKMEVVSAQVNGPVEVVKRWTYNPVGQDHAVTTSFQKESWKVLGRLKEWDDQGAVLFDRRDKARETALIERLFPRKSGRKPKEPLKLVLVAAESASSPFPYKDLLWTLLRLRFTRGYEVLDLSAIKAERFYDLLALYERAHCLVSVDTAPLQLARACTDLPVIALTNDRPLLWHGSSWRPNWAWCCRYHDFPERAVEMFKAIESCRDDFTQPFIHLWNNYDLRNPPQSHHRACLPVYPGSCGRDSANTLQDAKRVPYLKDCLRMAMQRAENGKPIAISRSGTMLHPLTAREVQLDSPFFAYRMTQNGHGDVFSPIADFFCAEKQWWKAHLDEIPDLLFGADYHWSEALRVMFQKHGAKDVTGVCYREGKQ